MLTAPVVQMIIQYKQSHTAGLILEKPGMFLALIQIRIFVLRIVVLAAVYKKIIGVIIVLRQSGAVHAGAVIPVISVR